MRTIDNPAQLKLDLFALQPANAQSDNLEVRYLHPQPVSSHSRKLADKLDKLAATMQITIDSKLHPAIGQQNITARRSRIAAQMREEGQRLAVVQRWLEGLAQAHRTGTCPPQFASIDNRKKLEDFATICRWYEDDSKYLQDSFTYGYSIVERLVQFGIKSNGYCGSRITKRREFTDWLDDIGVVGVASPVENRYDNLADAFTKSDRSCGVSTHLIHLKR